MKVVLMHGKNSDPGQKWYPWFAWVPFSAGELNAAGLSARFLSFNDCGHFGRSTNELLELPKEIIE